MIFSRLRNIVDEDHGTLVVYGPFKNDQGFFTENDEKVCFSSRCPNSLALGSSYSPPPPCQLECCMLIRLLDYNFTNLADDKSDSSTK